MVVDRASLQDGKYTIDGSDRLGQISWVASSAGDWNKGIAAGGQYALVRVEDDCISYIQVETEIFHDVLMVSDSLLWVAIVSGRVNNARMARFPAPCGSSVTIEAVDPRTDQLIERMDRVAPFARNGVAPHRRRGQERMRV